MASEPDVQHRADGRIEMRLETTGQNGTSPLLSWIADLKALAPESLRDRIAKLQEG